MPKIFAINNWMIGAAGGMQFISALPNDDKKTFQIEDLVNYIRENSPQEPSNVRGFPFYDINLLAAVCTDNGEVALYHIDNTLTVTPVPNGEVIAIGTGQEFAMGAAKALSKTDLNNMDIVRSAVEVAGIYDMNTQGLMSALVGEPEEKDDEKDEKSEPQRKARTIKRKNRAKKK